jgi:formylmethanofuran dehydrogenase subunit C
MSTLIFTLKSSVTQPIGCRALTPNNLSGKTLPEIKALRLDAQHSVADVFDVTGEATDHVVFKQARPLLHHIGYQMKTGQITIDGDAGNFTGAAMQGGVLICKGNVGERAGDAMRRGMLLIEGDTGEYCASSMKAGTLGVLGKTGARLGYGMKRGTLLLVHAPIPQAMWLDCGWHTLPFLNILYKSFKALDSKFAKLTQMRVQRWVGDISGLGKAEILVLSQD